ncbi:MAG: hypothetical protein AB1758_23945, partial [Candidatus Eremiobacterota bacterium]
GGRPRRDSGEWPDLAVDDVPNGPRVAIRFERRSHGTIQGVYNPQAGRVEWRTSQGRLAGVYNPVDGQVAWQSGSAPLAGLYNPDERAVRFQTNPKGSISGFYNPASGKERFERAFSGRRVGAVDPLTGREHWQTSFGSCTGLYDAEREEFRFETPPSGPIAAVSDDPACPTLGTNGTQREAVTPAPVRQEFGRGPW